MNCVSLIHNLLAHCIGFPQERIFLNLNSPITKSRLTFLTLTYILIHCHCRKRLQSLAHALLQRQKSHRARETYPAYAAIHSIICKKTNSPCSQEVAYSTCLVCFIQGYCLPTRLDVDMSLVWYKLAAKWVWCSYIPNGMVLLADLTTIT